MEKLAKSVEISREMINKVIFLCETRTKETYFTRNGKINFQNTLLFMLNLINNSLQLELDKYFEGVLMSKETITKQAYIQAREKISHKAFIMLNEAVVKNYYECEEYKTYKGYRLLAIDGSVIKMNNTKELREAFGYVISGDVHTARALAMAVYDVENDLIITSSLTMYGTSERKEAKNIINKIQELGKMNDVLIFDRGYPSKELIKYIEDNNLKYVMRVSSRYLKKINDANEEDQTVKIDIDNKFYTVRVVNFMINENTREKLITNITDESLLIEDFKVIYGKRWGIEVKYDEIKNKLHLENFTGRTKITVEQDFYAIMYLSNLVGFAKQDANEKIKKKNKGKDLKYEYRVNSNLLIGFLKDKLIQVFLEPSPFNRDLKFKQIEKAIIKNTVPIRVGRKNPRKKIRIPFKHPTNQKGNL